MHQNHETEINKQIDLYSMTVWAIRTAEWT